MKQSNWQLSLIFNSFRFSLFILLVCLTPASNSQMPHFGKAQPNSAASKRYYRLDSFTKIYNNRHNLQELQLAAELTTLINLQAQLDFRFTTQNLDQNLSINSSTTDI